MSQLIREKCGENPAENKLILFFKSPGKEQVGIKEWARALRNASPQTEEESQMLVDLKTGLSRAGDAAEVAVLAWQALAVVKMGSPRPPIPVVDVEPAAAE